MKLPFPDAILSQHIAAVGKTGSGKTSTAKLIIEHVVAGGARVCVLDPIKSDWWGLTSSMSGKSAGLPFHILGGPRGHVPLHAQAGAVIGEIVANGQLPLSILDMCDFEMGGLQQFFTHFAPMLLRKMRGVLYLVVEEAHEFAPKERGGFGNENMTIHFAKKLAVAGRSRGIRLIIATQRTQALHNAMLGSCDTLLAHRLTAPADQEPVVKWLKANLPPEKAKEVAASLQSLKTGEAWVCSGEAKFFERIQFPRISTYDNTATPSDDSGSVEVKTASVDHDHLRAIIGTAVEEAKANDPKELRAEIARLKTELTKKLTASPATPQKVEVPVVSGEDSSRIDALLDGVKNVETYVREASASLGAMARETSEIRDRLRGHRRPGEMVVDGGVRMATAIPARTPISFAAEPGNSLLPKGERAILTVCAQYPSGASREQVTVLTGYKRSSRDAYIQRLKEKQFISEKSEGMVATDAGINALGTYVPLPTGDDLRHYWLQRLPEGERRILEVLCAAYPNTVERTAIDAATGYQRSSRDAYLQRLNARRLIKLAAARGEVGATDQLFN